MIFNLEAGEVKTLPIANSKYPEDITVKAGTNAVFSAVIEKDGIPTEYTYQWYVNDSLVSGATNAVYTRTTSSDKGVYSVYCEITNKAGVVKTRTATLQVNALPKLDSAKPANVTCDIGKSITLEAAISEHGYPKTYTYQWYKNGSKISGANSNKYTFAPSSVGSTTFYCAVTNIAGTVNSRTATVKQIMYLYKAGNECTANTGGWKSTGLYMAKDDMYIPASDPTKNSTNMVFIARSTAAGKFNGLYTAKKINLSNCSVLKAEVTVNSLDYDGMPRWYIRALTGMNYYTDAAGGVSAPQSTGAATISWKVSALDSSYYITMMSGFTSEENEKAQTTVHNVWLE